MLGISRKALRSRIEDEKQAQSDYGKDISEAKRKGAKKTASTIGHIRREEQEHEGMLRKLGE